MCACVVEYFEISFLPNPYIYLYIYLYLPPSHAPVYHHVFAYALSNLAINEFLDKFAFVEFEEDK